MEFFKLPDLGEGLQEAEIVKWYVSEGDRIQVDQHLLSLETAKAVVDIPSPIAGKIVHVHGKPGDIIKTGAILVEYELDSVMSLKTQSGKCVKASPAVRALARRLKVELEHLKPSGVDNTITLNDVQEAATRDSTPLTGVRRAMAETMAHAYRDIVSVTVMEDAPLWNGSSVLDISVHLIQAIIKALKVEPALNAWYDAKNLRRTLINEVHLGLAIDAKDGLFVPVIHHAETLDSKQLREKMDVYKREVNERSIALENLKGATIALSNFGKFAGRYANPIIVPPMVAIIGAGRIRKEMVVRDDAPIVCSVLPLSLTFDHRVVTGGEASRFLDALIQSLNE